MKLKHIKIQEFDLTDNQIEILKKVKSNNTFLEYTDTQFKNLNDYFAKRNIKTDINVAEFLKRNENGTYGTAISLEKLGLLTIIPNRSDSLRRFYITDLGRELLEQNGL